MSTTRLRRRLRAATIGLTVLASGLGLVPGPVLGRGAPPGVGRAVPVAGEALGPATASATRAPSGGVRLDEPAWTAPRTTCAPIRFTMLGLVWRQRGPGEIPVRVSWG
ncbi:MAG TPA: hypothetical protein VG709_08630, partial [Actinomycetota bacterium]|nr:hypothetical protein [Actinomycetota bacterium]